MNSIQNLGVNIAFDESHQERGRIDSSLTQMNEVLAQKGYLCSHYAEFPITYKSLSPYHILVFACPDNSRISRQEIDDITKWVKEGRGLLMLSHAGGDKGRRSNLSELAEQFGMHFENDQVLDQINNLGVENLPTITDFPFPHPITDNIQEICYRAGCSLSLGGTNSTPVISSGPHSNPVESPLILAGMVGEGRVVGIGSYEMFRDNISGGISHSSHPQLLVNIMEWLTLESIPQKPSVNQAVSYTQTVTQNQVPFIAPGTNSAQQNPPNNPLQINKKEFESEIKIMSTEDLLGSFEDILTEFISFKERIHKEFDNLQGNIMNLIRSIIATENDMINIAELQNRIGELENAKFSPNSAKMDGFGATDQKLLDDLQRLSSGKTKADDNIDPTTLEALKSLDQFHKPKKTQETNGFPSSNNLTKSKYSKSSPAKSVTMKSPEEMAAELESLENKLKSIDNLTSFVEKKFAAGKLTQANYDKQVLKLKRDQKITKEKIIDLQSKL